MNKQEAARMVKILIGSYPFNNAPDPEMYVKAMKAAFLPYPFEAGEPAIGLVVSRNKFPPAPAGIIEALDEIMRPIRERNRRLQEHQSKIRQIEDREAMLARRAGQTPESEARIKKVVADMCKEMALSAPPKPTEQKPRPRHIPVTDEMRDQAFKSLREGRV